MLGAPAPPHFFTNVFFKNKYAALVPLWTSVMDSAKSNDGKNQEGTNANAECYYKIKKEEVHEVQHDKPSRFIAVDKRETLTNTNKVLLGARTDGKKFTEPLSEVECEDNGNNEELDNVKDNAEHKEKVDNVKKKPAVSTKASETSAKKIQKQERTIKAPRKKVEPVRKPKGNANELDMTVNAEEEWMSPKPKYTYSEGRFISETAALMTSTPLKDKRTSDLVSKISISCISEPSQTPFKRKLLCDDSEPSIKRKKDGSSELKTSQIDLKGKKDKWVRFNKHKSLSLSTKTARATSKNKIHEVAAMDANTKTINVASFQDKEGKEEKLLATTSQSTTTNQMNEGAAMDANANIIAAASFQEEEKLLATTEKATSTNEIHEVTAMDANTIGVASFHDDKQHEEKDVEIVDTEMPSLPDVIQLSHLLPYRPDLSHSAAPRFEQLNASDQHFIESETGGDMSALLFVFGPEENPIYLKMFVELLSDGDIGTPIMDACIFSLQRHYNNSNVFIATAGRGKEIIQEQKNIILSCHTLPKETEFLLIPVKVDKQWALVDVDIPEKEISIWQHEDNAHSRGVIAKKMKQFFDNNFPGTDEWKICAVSDSPYEEEREKFSGLQVLVIADTLLRRGKEAEYADLRVFLATLCLRHSSSKTSLCSPTPRNPSDFYANGLFKDVSYYFGGTESTEFIVAKFGNSLPLVSSSQFRSLRNSNDWISNSIIDASIHILVKGMPNVINVPCIEAGNILTKRFNSTCILNGITLSNKRIVMPYLQNMNHWRLVFVDVPGKAFMDLDPYNPGVDKKMMAKFIKFLENRGAAGFERINTDSWQCIGPPSEDWPTQKESDTSNCGLLSTASNLLQNAVNMKQLCLKCGHDQYHTMSRRNFATMISCDACYRWIHTRCSRKLKGIHPDVYMADDYKFVCDICDLRKERVETNPAQ
ncbi:hypothetical protein ONE63_004218 [Megalurothrips usitatus]|uniref:PHD-type domain-containing protein n=1 Tax=Megalurothrips usitatus TaxID=439358 RepID=A0AAV7X2Z5_9NEOP|nr:hypothetical protein ONE63_004218 [Megalurothrips usitatus]